MGRVSLPTGRIAPALAILFVFTFHVPAAAQSGYTLVEMPPLNLARDVNDHGVVVGFDVESLYAPPTAFLWTRTGGMQPMDTGEATFPDLLFELRINVHGVVVGTMCPPGCAGRSQPALWHDGTVTFLGNVPDGGQINPAAINSTGVVVGESYGERSVMPFIFVPGFGIHLLPGFTGIGRAADVNDWGLVTGSGGFLSDDTDLAGDAWVWLGGTAWTLPKVLGNHMHQAFAVNNLGQVAGRFFGPGGTGVFMWSAATGTIDLHAPPGLPARVEMNDRGEIVATIVGSGANQPFLYKNGRWTNINNLVPGGSPLHLDTVFGINNKGWIVGFGRNSPSDAVRGFVLIPPTVDIRANGQDQPLTLTTGDTLEIDLSFDASAGGPIPNGEVYVGVATDRAVFWLGSGRPSLIPSPIFSGEIPTFGPMPILNVADVSRLRRGKYRFFAIIDRSSNGVVDPDFVDVVEVIVKRGRRPDER